MSARRRLRTAARGTPDGDSRAAAAPRVLDDPPSNVSQSLRSRPRLRLPWQRGSTAHTSSVYPFSVHGPLCHSGALVGVDLLAGAGPFVWDPFEAYQQGLTTSPNAVVFGILGQRKSALVKTWLWRMFTLYGEQRQVLIADPKGEYITLAGHLGLSVIRLSPGGSTRINPLAPGPAARYEPAEKTAMRRADTLRDLLAAVLHRDLGPGEEAVLYSAVEEVVTGCAKEPTLADVCGLLLDPTEGMVARVRKPADELTSLGTDLFYALSNLLGQSLRGMFDGPSTVSLEDGALGVVVDLSGVEITSAAMPLVLMSATGWLQEALVCPGPRRLQITDELWVGAGDRHFVRHMQRCQKLSRTLGVANIQIGHRVTDAAAQTDSDTAEAKIAAGMLADADTTIILRQHADQLDAAQDAFGLSDVERGWVGSLAKGRALWLLGGQRAVVQHVLADSERALVDTDRRMRAGSHEFTPTEGSSGGNPRVDAA